MDNLVNSLVTKTIGLTDQQVKNNLLSNPNMNDFQLSQFMQTNGVSPSQMSTVSGVPEGKIAARVAATISPGNSVTLGDTVIAPQYRTTGSGMDEQIGPLEGFAMSKSNGDINFKAPEGTPVQIYSGDGEFVNTVKTKKDLSFFGGIKEMLKDPVVQAAILGVAGGAGAFDGLLGTTGTAGTGAGSAFELANAGAGAFEGGTALNSLAGTGAGSAFELANAGAGAFEGGTSLNALSGTGAGSAFEAANAGSTAMTDLGASELANAGASANTVGGTTLANAAGPAAGSTLAKTAGSALGTTLGQGLGLSALGTGLGAIANQSGISNARDLINQYGTKAEGNLARSYADAQALNRANRGDLTSNYARTQNKLGNIYDQQVEFQQPYQDVGRAGSQALVENVPYFNKQFGTADLYSGLAPNYEFMLGQGQMANQRAGNMAGGALGGNALQGLQRYTQDYAGNAYQQAFKNFQDQRQNIYGSLSGMANIGLNSAGQLANLGNTYGSNLAGLSSNYGNNLTTSYGQGIGAANAYGLNTANLATGIGGALASNATASGANTSTALSNLGNAALFGSMLKAT